MRLPSLQNIRTCMSNIGSNLGNTFSRARTSLMSIFLNHRYSQIEEEVIPNLSQKVTGLQNLLDLATKVQSSFANVFKRTPITQEQIRENPQKYLPRLNKNELLNPTTLTTIKGIVYGEKKKPEAMKAAQESLIKIAKLLLNSPPQPLDPSPDPKEAKEKQPIFTTIARHIASENLDKTTNIETKESLKKNSSISKNATTSLNKLTTILETLRVSLEDMPQLELTDPLSVQQEKLQVPLNTLNFTAKLTRFLKHSNQETKTSSPELKALLEKADTLQRNVLSKITPFVQKLEIEATEIKNESIEFNKIFDKNPEKAVKDRPPSKTASLHSPLWRKIIPTLLRRLPLDSIQDEEAKTTLISARKRQFGGPLPPSLIRNPNNKK